MCLCANLAGLRELAWGRVREVVKLLADELSTKINLSAWSFMRLTTHRGLDLSISALRFLSRLLTARRRELGTRWRLLPEDRQALLVLAHLWWGHVALAVGAGAGVLGWGSSGVRASHLPMRL